MKKKESVAKRIGFIIGLIVVFGIILLWMGMAQCYDFTFILLAGIIIGLILIRKTKLWKGAKTFLFWCIAIGLSLLIVVFARPNADVSIQGVIARESIKIVLNLTNLKGDGMLDMGKKFADKKSEWKVPKGYTLKSYDVDGLPLEILKCSGGKEDKVIFQLHGGAYVIDYSDLYRDTALKYSKLSGGAAIVSIDYRIAPEYTFPSALEDAQKGWEWLLKKGYEPQDIIVAGDSAGGNLALALVEKLRDSGKEVPRAMVLMSPWADLAGEGTSYTANLYIDPIFGLNDGEIKNTEHPGKIIAYAGNTDLHNKYLSPVYGDFDGFPAMLIQVGTYELLQSDAETVYKKAKEAGVDVTLTEYKGMFHVFQLMGNLIPESKAAWKQVGEFLQSQM